MFQEIRGVFPLTKLLKIYYKMLQSLQGYSEYLIALKKLVNSNYSLKIVKYKILLYVFVTFQFYLSLSLSLRFHCKGVEHKIDRIHKRAL